jgi:hypothetical protein
MTQARILADYASGIGTQGATLTVDGDNRAVAIGTTNVSGIGNTVHALTVSSGSNTTLLIRKEANQKNAAQFEVDTTSLKIESDETGEYNNSTIKLRVDGSTMMQINSTGQVSLGNSHDGADSNTPYLVGYGTAVSFDGGGSVGIASTNPDHTLSVTGNVGVHTLYQYYPAVKTSYRRNMIDNGGMRIAQLGISTSVTLPITSRSATNGCMVCDRWLITSNMDNAVGMSRSVGFGTDTGHHYALHIDCNGTETPTSGEYFFLNQRFNSRDDIEPLRYGYANAKESIYSFWCRSNKTGTFTVEFRNVDPARIFVKEVTINSANTWEFKHFIVPADTDPASAYGDSSLVDGVSDFAIYHWLDNGSNFSSGTPDSTWIDSDDTKRGGSFGLMDSASNWFEMTGVQWEVAHPGQKYPSEFEYMRFEEDLRVCQRYVQTSYDYHPGDEKIPGQVTSLGATYHRHTNGSQVTNHPTSVRFTVPMAGSPAMTGYSLNGKRNSASDCTTNYDHASEVGISQFEKVGSQGYGGISLSASKDDIVGWHWVAFVD